MNSGDSTIAQCPILSSGELGGCSTFENPVYNGIISMAVTSIGSSDFLYTSNYQGGTDTNKVAMGICKFNSDMKLNECSGVEWWVIL